MSKTETPRKPLTVRVLTYEKSDLENPMADRYFVISDRDNYEAFKKHLIWAATNEKSMEIFNMDDESFFM